VCANIKQIPMSAVENAAIDEVDRVILGELVRNGRASYRELGALAGLSANAAADRVRRLQRRGVITGFTATLDPSAAGRSLHALVDVRLGPERESDDFAADVAGIDQVVDAVHVTGRFDYHLRLACRDALELDELLRTFRRRLGVVETETRIVLRTDVRRA
jgi:Lrp/AsnC family transcriptional regulator, leucine-responsive regulatory protein